MIKIHDNVSLVEEIVSFEKVNEVECFTYRDIFAWPCLRLLFAFKWRDVHQAYSPVQDNQTTVGLERPRTESWKRKIQMMWQARGEKKHLHPRAKVLFFSWSNRLRDIDGVLYNSIVDIPAGIIQGQGVPVIVYEEKSCSQARLVPTGSISNYIRGRTKTGRILKGNQTPRDYPEWIDLFCRWMGNNVDSSISPLYVVNHLERLYCLSRVYQAVFKNIQPQAVVIDVWYGWTYFPVTIAAHRLGIKTVDIQHGSQGRSHFAYADWFKPAPKNFYSPVPQAFWVWGETAREDMLRLNESFFEEERIAVVGNHWLNCWVDESLPGITAEIERVKKLSPTSGGPRILVTLQPFADYGSLYRAMELSPDHWNWMIRFHPGMDKAQRADMTRRFYKARPGAVIEGVSGSLLFPQFHLVDVHLTHDSTCALEALAFGCPTVTFHQRGLQRFEEFIRKEVMLYAPQEDSRQIIEAVERLLHTSERLCRGAARRVFAPPRKDLVSLL
ncbi:MAG: hypothetical protein JXB45_01000 [Candidatus Krumholzibacteriota bacterium]|nr:hypothetical protein [Candidatus Krumholzibacteriota bacterium]